MYRPKNAYSLILTAAAAMVLTHAALTDAKAEERSYLPPQHLQAPKPESAPAQSPAKPYPRTALNRIPKSYPRTSQYRSSGRLSHRHYAHRHRGPYLRRYASPGFFPGIFSGLFR
jgi:hypothetical protein